MKWSEIKMTYILFGVIAIYVLLSFVAMFSEKHNAKQKARFEKELNERCDNILESVARTEATIAEERKLYWALPEEHRKEFLAKYDEIEKKCQDIRKDVARIRDDCQKGNASHEV